MTDEIAKLKTFATINQLDPVMKREVQDAQWADYGRRVHENMQHHNFLRAFNLASMRVDKTADLVDLMRVYLLTGVLPS